jgi:antirestriction protein ArdC
MNTIQAPRDLHAEITNQLIAAIEANPGKPALPWLTGGPTAMPHNALSNKAYNGINIVSLWVAAASRGFSTQAWGTYRQWQEKGAQVRKGEKSSLVVFYKEYDTDPDPEDASDSGKRRMARASYVFNGDQVDGYQPPEPPTSLGPIERKARADQFIEATKASISHGGERASYDPSTDRITMPEEGRFTGTATMDRSEGYYATLVHELVHWSGAKHRLDRDMSGRFGNEAYAAEEPVAEIGAAFLCAELQITQDMRPDHAAYLANWLRILKNDNRAIFAAAARASEATTFLRGRTA